MPVLKQEKFITIKGEPFRFYSEQGGTNGKLPYKELSVAAFLLMVLDSFQPNPQLGMVLSMGEIRHLNEVATMLESEDAPQYDLTQDQMAVVKKVVGWWVPLMPGGFMRNGPALVDYLEAAS